MRETICKLQYYADTTTTELTTIDILDALVANSLSCEFSRATDDFMTFGDVCSTQISAKFNVSILKSILATYGIDFEALIDRQELYLYVRIKENGEIKDFIPQSTMVITETAYSKGFKFVTFTAYDALYLWKRLDINAGVTEMLYSDLSISEIIASVSETSHITIYNLENLSGTAILEQPFLPFFKGVLTVTKCTVRAVLQSVFQILGAFIEYSYIERTTDETGIPTQTCVVVISLLQTVNNRSIQDSLIDNIKLSSSLSYAICEQPVALKILSAHSSGEDLRYPILVGAETPIGVYKIQNNVFLSGYLYENEEVYSEALLAPMYENIRWQPYVSGTIDVQKSVPIANEMHLLSVGNNRVIYPLKVSMSGTHLYTQSITCVGSRQIQSDNIAMVDGLEIEYTPAKMEMFFTFPETEISIPSGELYSIYTLRFRTDLWQTPLVLATQVDKNATTDDIEDSLARYIYIDDEQISAAAYTVNKYAVTAQSNLYYGEIIFTPPNRSELTIGLKSPIGTITVNTFPALVLKSKNAKYAEE